MNYIDRKGFMYGGADDFGYGVDAGIGSSISSGPGGGDPNAGDGGGGDNDQGFNAQGAYFTPKNQGILQNLGDRFSSGARTIGDYYKNNSRGILGSMIGSALLGGPLGLILGGYAGRNFDSIRDRFYSDVETDENENTELRANPFLTQFGVMPNQKPDIFQEGPYPGIPENQMANKPDYKVGDISDKTFNAAIGSGFNPYTGEELQPGEAQELEDQRNNQSNLGLGSFIV